MRLPPNLAKKIGTVWGGKGQEWVSRFEQVYEHAVKKWGLDEIQPFDNLSYHFVARAKRDSASVVLKLGVPEPWLAREADALAAFKDGPVVRILEADMELAALLLEDALPGTSLQDSWTEAADEGHTRILAETMIGLWREPPLGHAFDTTQALAKALARLTRFVPEKLVAEASARWQGLQSGAPTPMLLHGDLHHGNVLLSQSGHKAIDPMGVVGDPAFEVYALLHNPVQATMDQLLRLWEPRLRTVSAVTGLDFHRLKVWGFCGIVLSSCWDEEDGGEPDGFELAEALL